MRHLAEDPSFVGIGFAKAAKLVKEFGDRLPRLLAEGDPEPFVPVVGQEPAEALVRAWRDDLARHDVVVWLAENDFDTRLARKIVRLWGADGARHVRAHPYALMALADWPVVDATARRLGVPQDAPARLVAAVEAVLYDRLQQQHTWTSDAELRRRLGKLLELSREATGRAVRSAAEVGAADPVQGGWRPAGAAMMERFVVDRVRAMADGPAIGDLIARYVSTDELSGWLAQARGTLGVELDDEQRAALDVAVRRGIGMVLGGAGVGKTTVLRAVCGACEAFGRTVHLMALAGRAAVRMSEATGRKASTIAAFLKTCDRGAVPLGPESLIVVDEASMLDLPTLYRLLRAMPDGARLLLVGDEAQLPPIGFGLTLHAFVHWDIVPKVRLTRVYRQTAQSGIPAVAASVREGRLDDLPSSLGGGAGVTLVATEGPVTTDDVIQVIAGLGGFGNDLRILSPVKGGEAGTLALNARFHDMLAVGRARLANRAIALGEPVIFGRNDYRRDLRNGSLGTVVAVQDEALTVDFEGTLHELGGVALDDLSLAYAITVHKAQGSQFRTVVVPVPASRIVDRSLVYTALTRATDRVVLVGQVTTIRQAVSRPPAAEGRDTGLRWL